MLVLGNRLAMLGLLLVALTCSFASANVIGLDFGTEFMKIAIVQPGSPFEVVTNLQSKRKTETVVTFYKGDRFYGTDAAQYITRKPESAFHKINTIVGRHVEHPAVKKLAEHYSGMKVYQNDTRGGLCVEHESTYYTPEELMSMLLSYVKEIVQHYGGNSIRDCVITVPAFFTQHERRAVFSAAEIADMKVLSLIDENTAAAVQFGIDRVFETPHRVLYYNMGASSTQVTIVEYSSYNVTEAGKTKLIGTFDVKGKAWDTSLGGHAFDLRLTELLADRFNEKLGSGGDVRKHIRPMNKLRTQAKKVKEVLSANPEIPVIVEALYDDKDLRTHMSRDEFEAMCSDLFSRVTGPVDQALAFANISKDEIDTIELIGGSVRIPKVQVVLKEYFDGRELGMHLNGDEAMALGAAFRAANLSTAFRVRKVGMQEITTFPIKIELESLDSKGGFFAQMLNFLSSSKETPEEEPWSKSTLLYEANSKIPKKKTLVFSHDRDIVCKISYDDTIVPMPDGTSPLIAVYNITGVADFAKEVSSKGLSPKVHLSFQLDNSGIVSLASAEATVEEPEETLQAESNDTDSSVASDANNGTAEAVTSESVEAADSTNTTATNATESETASETLAKKASKKKKKKALKKALKIVEEFQFVTPSPHSETELEVSKARMLELKRVDDVKKEREAAKNSLESYLYSVRNKFSDLETELQTVSTSEQREEVLAMVGELEDWLYDEGEMTVVSEYRSRQSKIRTIAEKIFLRLAESADRPAAVSQTRTSLAKIKLMVQEWEKSRPWISEKEREDVYSEIEKVLTWITDKESEQSKLTPFEDPVFTSDDLKLKIKPVQNVIERLKRKPKPPPAPKQKVNATEGDSTKNETASTSTDETETVEPAAEEPQSNSEETAEEESTSTEGESISTEDEPSRTEGESTSDEPDEL